MCGWSTTTTANWRSATVGEMLVRTDRPWAMTHGYFKIPEATARSWRNGWFHTGDAFRVDAEELLLR